MYYPIKLRSSENALWTLPISRCSVSCDPIIFHEVTEEEYTYIATLCKPRRWVVNATLRPLHLQRRAPVYIVQEVVGVLWTVRTDVNKMKFFPSMCFKPNPPTCRSLYGQRRPASTLQVLNILVTEKI